MAPLEIPKLKPSEFEEIRTFAKQRFGLDLRHGKEDLVSARLARAMRQGRYLSFRDYLDHVNSDGTGESLIALINALTTNHTSFYREPQHFDFLVNNVLPDLAPGTELKIWSAACSTGEEPYSIACTVAQAWNGRIQRLRILATDISTRVLEIAEAAVYGESLLTDTPAAWRTSYFKRVPERDGSLRLKPELTRTVVFRRLNLMETFPFCDRFRVIFCRNVMIYFDKPTQERLVHRLADHLEPDGYLFVGHSESLAGVNHPLRYVRPAIYRKAPRKRGS